MIILNTVIIVITRPKLAYGRQGLAGVTLRASGAQLKVNKNVTDIHFIMIYTYIITNIILQSLWKRVHLWIRQLPALQGGHIAPQPELLHLDDDHGDQDDDDDEDDGDDDDHDDHDDDVDDESTATGTASFWKTLIITIILIIFSWLSWRRLP